MTKISTPGYFDEAAVANTSAGKELKPFIDYANQFFQNVTQILQSGVSLGDNTDSAILTVVSLGGPTKVLVKSPPTIVLLGKQNPTTPSVNYFSWENSTDSNIEIIVTFASQPFSPVTLTLVVFFS